MYKTVNRTQLSLTFKIIAIAVFFNLSNSVVNSFLALFFYLKYDVSMDARKIKQTSRNGPQLRQLLRYFTRVYISRQGDNVQ